MTFFILLLVCAWLIPNSFYAVYMHIARVVAGGFLLLQLIILVDAAYSWNADWTSEERGMQKAVLGVCALLYAAALTAFILMLVYFGHSGDPCHLQKFFIAFTFCTTALLTALSVSNVIVEGGGLLPAGCVTVYAYWLLFSALTSDPSVCNTVGSHSREFVPLVIGLILTTASVTYASWSVATNTTLFENEPLHAAGSTDEEKASGRTVRSDDADDDEAEEVEEPVDSVKSVAQAALSARFHLLMACASMYVCMLLSAWGSQATAEDSGSPIDLDYTNLWIKIVTQWLCILLYVWTLIAPLVCSGRDFN